ncbi:MAG: TlpA family protein disulfide reductase [Planctomycetaceae bacterium]|nr:TlpA family protein disulfide reductase [Planctomycetaceae bacterium]
MAAAWRDFGMAATMAALVTVAGCTPEPTAPPAGGETAAAAAATGPASPAPAPAATAEITLKPVDKAQLEAAIQAHAGQVVLVDFWATWCGPCKEQFPHTLELAHKYRDQGLAVISVSCDDADGQAGALEFLKSKGADIENLISTDGIDAIDVLEIEGGALPHYRIYDRQGKLVKSFGPDPDRGLSPEEIEVFVKEALAAPKS